MKNFSLVILLISLLILGFLMKKQSETKVSVPSNMSSTPIELQKLPDATEKHLKEQIKLQQEKLDREIPSEK